MVTEVDINAGYSKRQTGEGEMVVSKLTQEAVRHSHVTRRTGVVEERRAIHERYPVVNGRATEQAAHLVMES